MLTPGGGGWGAQPSTGDQRAHRLAADAGGGDTMTDRSFESLAFEIPDVVPLLLRARDGQRRALVTAAEDRSKLERETREGRAGANARVDAIAPDQTLLDRFSRAWNEYGEPGGEPIAAGPAPASIDSATSAWRDAVGRCKGHLDRFREARTRYEAQSQKLFSRAGPPPRIPDEFRQDLWAMQAIIDAWPELRAREVDDTVADLAARGRSDVAARAAGREAELASIMAEAESEVAVAAGLLGTSGMAWSQLLDRDWSAPPWVDGRARVGTFDVAAPGRSLAQAACVLPFPASRGLAIDAPAARREDAIALARSIVLRVLASTPPGKTEVTFIDPVAIGASIADLLHLGDYDARLVDTRPRTSMAEIESRLAEHASHVETVISKYLRGQFRSLDEYNQAAGEMAEALRLVVIFDFPAQFSDRATEQLLSIIENGPRCGIVTLLVHDPERKPSREVSTERLLRSMDRLTWRGDRVVVRTGAVDVPIEVVPDRCPDLLFDVGGKPQSPAAQLLAAIGSAARRTEDTVIDLDRTFRILGGLIDGGLATRVPELAPAAAPVVPSLPDTWWAGTTATRAVAPIGRIGAQDIASLHFSSTEIAGGALMIGLPRSGKTTSLHAAILSMCLLYGPDELELYLIDAKHGVEFNAYRELPHARMVAINREREFAVAVLQSLDREIERRAATMKQETPGRTNLQEYRAASGAKLPRIVVVIDEFHELFELDDQFGQAAFDAFSNIVRQGPFAGVHLVLASQTLTSMPAMDRSTLMLLPTRVAFACNDSDAQLVMGDDNPEPRFLEKAGDGLLNANRGNPTNNQRFRGVYVDADERTALVDAMVRRAVADGFDRRPRVFDGDAMVRRESVASSAFLQPDERPHRVRCLVGEALALESDLAIVFRRDQEANLLVVAPGDDDGLPEVTGMGVLHSVLLAARAQAGHVVVLDFTNDEGHAGTLDLDGLCERLSVAYHRRQRSVAAIRELAALVDERVALEDHRSTAVVLVICGIGRAGDLDPDAYAMDDEEEPLATALLRVLRDGPEVGVHTTVLTDSAGALQRRLGTHAMDRFGFRIAGRLRGDSERQAVLDDFRGLEVRGSQLVLFDRRTERRTKFQPYGPLDEAWLALAMIEADLQPTTSREDTDR